MRHPIALQKKIVLARASWLMGRAVFPCGEPAEVSGKVIRLSDGVVSAVFMMETHVWKILVPLDITVLKVTRHCDQGRVPEVHQRREMEGMTRCREEDIGPDTYISIARKTPPCSQPVALRCWVLWTQQSDRTELISRPCLKHSLSSQELRYKT